MQPEPTPERFLEFVRSQTRKQRSADTTPGSLDEWLERKKAIRQRLAQSYGEFPGNASDLESRILGTVERDGYRIERLIFQSWPGIWVTANAYVPTRVEGKRPAVLSVHGHWPWARIDPVPHARAVGLVKLGYFVLAVDAFGAGERAIEPARGTYHGALLGASTWPVGTPLLGLQIYDNLRAVDYLISRAEVDADKLAITGASGGGNQSMNAGAWDERLKVVVPVCSVGTYDAYLGAACCICEVLPGGLAIGEEGDILSLVAPRALMVINATRDAHQFSVGEAEKSIARARPVFELFNASDRLKHVVVESGHAYNQPMREALYGWLSRWLLGEGDGSPIPEPELELEELETLRCFPDQPRPQSFTLMPAFVQSMAKEKVSRIKRTDHREMWEADALLLKTRLEHRIFGGFPRTSPWTFEPGTTSEGQDTRRETLTLFPEPGMPVPAVLVRGRALRGPLPTAVIVNPTGKESALESRQVHGLLSGGWQIVAMDLRATGATAIRNDVIAGAVGHNSVEWSNWMGRPLLGQWCWDVIRMLDYLTARDDVEARNIALVSRGAGALVAVCAGCLDERVHAVATFGMLASFLTPSPFQGHHMATMVPFLLDIGDVEHLAALLAPRDLIIAGPVNAQNLPLSDQDSRAAFQFTRRTYGWFQAVRQLRVDAEFPDELLAEKLHGT